MLHIPLITSVFWNQRRENRPEFWQDANVIIVKSIFVRIMRNKLACLSMQDFDPSDCVLIRNLAEIVYAHQSSCLIPPGNIGAGSSELEAVDALV
jgi:hypothetical protein